MAQTQTPALMYQEGRSIDHTPVADEYAGDVVLVGTIPGVVPQGGNAAGVKGSLDINFVFRVPKNSDVFTAGDAVYWDVDGSPVTGTVLTGACGTSSAIGNLMGVCIEDAAAGDSYAKVLLTAAKRTTSIAGSVTADDISASDAALTIAGLAAAQGGTVVVVGGTSSTAGNAGGAITITGGTPGATGVGGAVVIAGADAIGGNANGGALTIRGGNANGTGVDGVLSLGVTNTSAINVGAAGIVTRNAGHHQAGGNAAVTATTGGATTGLIPAGASYVTVTSDSADKQISLPAGTIGDVIRILVGSTACELISAVGADKVNDVTVGATNELALTADALYRCEYTKSGFWIVTGQTKLGAAIAALVPDAL